MNSSIANTIPDNIIPAERTTIAAKMCSRLNGFGFSAPRYKDASFSSGLVWVEITWAAIPDSIRILTTAVTSSV